MENFITGYPAHERERPTWNLAEASQDQMRAGLLKVLGRDKYEFFFDKVRHARNHRTCNARTALLTGAVLGILLHRRGCRGVPGHGLQRDPAWNQLPSLRGRHESSGVQVRGSEALGSSHRHRELRKPML
jgi:hypothetical protein